MDVTVTSEGHKATVSIPSLSYTEFDRTGNVNVIQIQSLLRIARIVAYHSPNIESGLGFIEYYSLLTNTFTVMASTSTYFDISLFELTRSDKLPSFAIDLYPGYVGNKSFNTVAKLHCKDTRQVYAESTNQEVLLEKSTRKPAPLPEWWRAKYSQYAQGQSLVFDRLKIPDLSHRYKVKVAWTDMGLVHTISIHYFRFCQDAAIDATNAGFFSGIKGDFLEYKVDKMDISYIGETVANDVLTVLVWENQENPWMIHFAIMKSDKTLILENTFTLFEPDVA